MKTKLILPLFGIILIGVLFLKNTKRVFLKKPYFKSHDIAHIHWNTLGKKRLKNTNLLSGEWVLSDTYHKDKKTLRQLGKTTEELHQEGGVLSPDLNHYTLKLKIDVFELPISSGSKGPHVSIAIQKNGMGYERTQPARWCPLKNNIGFEFTRFIDEKQQQTSDQTLIRCLSNNGNNLICQVALISKGFMPKKTKHLGFYEFQKKSESNQKVAGFFQ
ncbi:MAG: hypothetical protein CL678_00265 [Bdellovibrionaceae bacterium]|nr:hypothetical protein [Pseudobdellovibrionaceae bacterium]|tara:strand:- start:5006 stop:5656 length:651 start_codon:yes stop_codon:yes gene_type:complete